MVRRTLVSEVELVATNLRFSCGKLHYSLDRDSFCVYALGRKSLKRWGTIRVGDVLDVTIISHPIRVISFDETGMNAETAPLHSYLGPVSVKVKIADLLLEVLRRPRDYEVVVEF